MVAGGFFEKNEKYIAGVFLALVVLAIIYIPPYIASKPPASLYAPLCKFTGSLDSNLIRAEKQRVNVPDYDADIFVEPRKEKYNVETNVEFTVKIKDKGIRKLNSSYFYIFLVDSDNFMRGIFPCFCGQTEFKIEPYGYRCIGNDCGFSGGSAKLAQWTKGFEYNGLDGRGYHCTDTENSFCVAGDCRSRTSIVEGIIDDKELVYTFNVDKPGTWKVYAFLFEENYFPRSFAVSMDNMAYSNAIAVGESTFEVVREAPRQGPNIWWIMSKILTVFVTFASLITLCGFFYDKGKSFCIKYKNQLIFIAVVVILIMIASFFVCRIACPVRGLR